MKCVFVARALVSIVCPYLRMSGQPSRIIYRGRARAVHQDIFLSMPKHLMKDLLLRLMAFPVLSGVH